MAAGSAPVATAAAATQAPEPEKEAIFSVASVMDTEGPARANELTVMPTPVANAAGGAASAVEEEPERDYSSLLINPGGQ
jgi:hypothetical protein